MFLQKECPKPNDPFFNTAANGGVSTCIVIKNCAYGLNTLPNCVSGAVGSFNKAGCADIAKPVFKYLNYPPNAENILEYAQKQGLPTSMIPEVGCIMVFRKGATLNSNDGAGHVIFVNQIDADLTVHSSESEYNGRTWVNNLYKNVFPMLYRGVPNASAYVKQLQEKLATVKSPKGGTYLRKSEIDGDFGTITFGALLAYQYDHKLEVDGVCGPMTKKSLGLVNYVYGSAYTYIGSVLLPKSK